jgi:hypothetical protein
MVFGYFLERYRKYNSRQVTFLPHQAALAVLMSYPPRRRSRHPPGIQQRKSSGGRAAASERESDYLLFL